MEKRVKTGGREKGTPNKLTRELRETLKTIVELEIEAMPAMIENLPDDKRLEVLVRLLPYVLPKIAPEQSPDSTAPGEKLIMPMFVMDPTKTSTAE